MGLASPRFLPRKTHISRDTASMSHPSSTTRMNRRVGPTLMVGFVFASMLSSAACEGKTAHPSATQTELERVASSPTPRLEPTSEVQPLPLASLPPAPTADTGTSRARRRLVNATVGYSLDYPPDWKVQGQVVATDFALGAQCQSVEIVDFLPPEGSGPGAVILHSFVQICARPLGDGLTLEAFMRQTYGEALGTQFEATQLGDVPAYRTKLNGPDATVFVHTDRYRLQIVSAVVAEPAMEEARAAEIRQVLESLVVIR